MLQASRLKLTASFNEQERQARLVLYSGGSLQKLKITPKKLICLISSQTTLNIRHNHQTGKDTRKNNFLY